MVAELHWYPSAIKGDDQIVGRFEIQHIIDRPASVEADKEITKPTLVVIEKAKASIDDTAIKITQGNREKYITKYPMAWQAFRGEEVQIVGTPLSAMGLNAAEIQKYEIMAIFSVEDLAGLTDAACTNAGFGARTRRNEAQAFLKDGTKASPPPPPPAVTRHPNMPTREDGESMEAYAMRLLAMSGKVPEAAPKAAEPEPRRRGRPPKVAAA